MALWGLIIAAILAIGFLLLFVGLAIAVPSTFELASLPQGCAPHPRRDFG